MTDDTNTRPPRAAPAMPPTGAHCRPRRRRVADVVELEKLAKWANDRSMDEQEVYADESMPRVDREMALAESKRYQAVAALALSRAPAVASVAKLRGLVERWQENAKMSVRERAGVWRECAADLARLIGEEKKDNG